MKPLLCCFFSTFHFSEPHRPYYWKLKFKERQIFIGAAVTLFWGLSFSWQIIDVLRTWRVRNMITHFTAVCAVGVSAPDRLCESNTCQRAADGIIGLSSDKSLRWSSSDLDLAGVRWRTVTQSNNIMVCRENGLSA